MIHPRKQLPKLTISPPSPKQKRMSIEETMLRNMNPKSPSFMNLELIKSSPDTSRVRTEPTPSEIFSVSDFWKIQPPNTPKKFTFVKAEGDGDYVNRYVSKVLINTQTNILQAFKKLLRPSAKHLKSKKLNKENRWFKISSRILALNSRLNEQKSLWRLKGIEQPPEKSSYHKHIDMVIYPQQYITYEPKFRALNSLETLVQANELGKIINLFRKNCRQYQIKQSSLKRIRKKMLNTLHIAILKMRCLPNTNKNKRYFTIKQQLGKWITHTQNKNVKEVFETFKADKQSGRLRKTGATSQISKMAERNIDRAFGKWMQFSKTKTQNMRKEAVENMFKIVQEKQGESFSYIFRGFDPNLRSKFTQKMERLMKIEEEFRNQHLKRTMKKWRKRDNQWFGRAVRIVALNTLLNQQTALWRLKEKTM